MNMGPETGLTWAKSIRPTSATVDAEDIWPPEASATSNSSDVPGAMRITGGRLLSQPR